MYPEYSSSTEYRRNPNVVAMYAAELLFQDEGKFNLYQEFRERYVGEPDTGRHPDIIRSRGGVEMEYTHQLTSGMTAIGSHLLYVSQGHGLKSTGMDPTAQYFVATADFKTLDITEWWVYKVDHDYQKSKKLILYLSDQAVHEVVQQPQIDPKLSQFEQDRITEEAIEAQKFADRAAIKYTLADGHSELSWGGNEAHDRFRPFEAIHRGLVALHEREQAHPDLITQPSHQSFRKYFTQAA